MIWRIRLNFVLACIATAAFTVVFCAETVVIWQAVVAGIAAVVIGLYCGLWLPKENGGDVG